MKNAFFSVLFLVIVLSQFTFAQIPQTMSYQGILAESDGTPVADGSYSLTFKLYDDSVLGDTLWQETQNVEVTGGIFNTILGSTTPLNLPFDKQYWLGITVGSGSELAPRIALTASPYSLNSHSTLAETTPGQGLTIRNSSGEPTHQFDANGDVTHTGVGQFLSGIIVGDSVIVPPDTLSILGSIGKNPEQIMDSKNPQELKDVGASIKGKTYGVIASGDFRAVYAESPEGYGVEGKGKTMGVFGYSKNGTGVDGHSQSYIGVYGASYSNAGVYGNSSTGEGVYGISESNVGVHGESIGSTGVEGSSESGTGVEGFSESGAGVEGFSKSNVGVHGESIGFYGVEGRSQNGPGIVGMGEYGGLFWNKVKINEVPSAPNQERFLVWDDDYVVKYRDMPSFESFNGVLQDKALVVRIGQTEVFRVDTNGNSYHKGVETFDDDVIFKGTDGKGAKLVDATGTTIAGFGSKDLQTGQRIGVYGKAENSGDLAGAFDGDVDVNGEIVTASLHIVDGEGDTLTSFNSDGTSVHSGLETYKAGIYLPDHNTENTSPTVKAGKLEPHQGADKSTFLQQHFWNKVDVPRLEGGVISLSPTVDNEPTIWGYTERTTGAALCGQSMNTSNSYPATWGVNFGGGCGILGEVRNSSSIYPGIWAITYGTASALLIDHQGSSGNILTGRSSGANQVRIDKTGKGFFNGGTQTGGADIAEAFEVEGIVEEYEAGDVMVISTESDRTMRKSNTPYSTLVAGVYATKPGVMLTERNIDDPHEDTIPLGVIGVIPTKVSGENGMIHRGDLLVTSNIPGHAMKGTDRDKMMGAVLGKALENFQSDGTGVIRVLVNTK